MNGLKICYWVSRHSEEQSRYAEFDKLKVILRKLKLAGFKGGGSSGYSGFVKAFWVLIQIAIMLSLYNTYHAII